MKYALHAILALTATLSFTALCGQNMKLMKLGFTEYQGQVLYARPLTTLVVDLTVAKETVVKGPYARYAQKYLGVIAPLADKETYCIESAVLGYFEGEIAPVADIPVQGVVQAEAVSHISSPDGFTRLQIDRTQVAERPAEEMARTAATIIFTLRRRRIELITGELGEGVFGDGLKAALDKIDYLEQEYLSLFLGKQTVVKTTERFRVVPVKGTQSYIVCRFDANEGVLPAENLSGEPVVLSCKPHNNVSEMLVVSPKNVGVAYENKARKSQSFAVADNVACRLMLAKRELAQNVMPIYQFGLELDIPQGEITILDFK